MKMNRIRWIPLMVLVIFMTAALQQVIKERSQASILEKDLLVSLPFRAQDLDEILFQDIRAQERAGGNFGEILTVSMLQGNFSPGKILCDPSVYLRYKPKKFRILKKAYEAVWSDVQYFPVAARENFFEDTFGSSRNYGGNRIHEGTDIFGKKQISGYYPVISMTDGTVEKTGWLPLGGYRIGIRAPHGGYYYYAHLSGYEKEFVTGETLRAGDILGYMGNTGYGKEGTTGKFPVHLHLGIYIPVSDSGDISVNPYRILRAFHKNIINYAL